METDIFNLIKERFSKHGIEPKESPDFGGGECVRYDFETHEKYTAAIGALSLKVRNSQDMFEYWIPIQGEGHTIIIPRHEAETARTALLEAGVDVKGNPVSGNERRVRFDFRTNSDCVVASWELGQTDQDMQVWIKISKKSLSLAVELPESATKDDGDEIPAARPFKVGERVWDDEAKEFCHIAGIPGSAGVLDDDSTVIVAYEDGKTRGTYAREIYKIAPGKTFKGMAVCYEHNRTEHGYPYYCPEASENCFENELD